MHRPLAEHENLDGAMCRKEFRTLSQALTLRYDKVLFILDPTDFAKRGFTPQRQSGGAARPVLRPSAASSPAGARDNPASAAAGGNWVTATSFSHQSSLSLSAGRVRCSTERHPRAR